MLNIDITYFLAVLQVVISGLVVWAIKLQWKMWSQIIRLEQWQSDHIKSNDESYLTLDARLKQLESEVRRGTSPVS